MGKATRWLKGLLGMKKDKEKVDNLSGFKEKKENKRWSFCVSSSEKHYYSESNIDHSVWLRSFVSETDQEKEQNKHAIAVASASAAAADAAAAAAQAAVEVVRLTNQGRLLLSGKREFNNAAVKIQAVFRGSLSRKALRALKGLVKLQALVRGYLVRKRAAATLHSMQALFRAQFAVCSQRALLSSSNKNTSKYPSHFRAARRSMEKMEESRSEYHHSRRLSASYEYDSSFNGVEEIPSPKIIGIDTCKHKSRSRRIHTCKSDSGEDHHHYYYYSIPCPPNSARLSIPNNYPQQLDECCKFATAQNTPRFMNCGVMSEAAPVTTTTTKSVGGGDGYFRQRYSNYNPSYMANTQSFNAKSRSHSAPKQRIIEGMAMPTRKGLSLNEMMASRLSFSGVRMQRPCLQVEEDFN